MSAPRLVMDLNKISYNTEILVSRLQAKGISVTGITKAFLGAPQIAQTMLRAGVTSLGDSRIENIERMRAAGMIERMVLIRSPMLSQVDRVVASADMSLNTEMKVLSALSQAAITAKKVHEVLLMVELGDLREGILSQDIKSIVEQVRGLPNIKFIGLGTNLACSNGVSPDDLNMNELSEIVAQVADASEAYPIMVSGGNSANINWVFSGGQIGRINNLRLGEAILLGKETLHRADISGLHTDAISLIAEVIESKSKPSKPWGSVAQSAFNNVHELNDNGSINQAILAIGRQDIDPDGLQPPEGCKILNASSDHLVIDAGARTLPIGSQLTFQLNYSALLRAMTSPYITKKFVGSEARKPAHGYLIPSIQPKAIKHFVHL